MKRPIKFRGRVTANFEHGMHKGKLIFGTLQDHSTVHVKREGWNSGYWIYPGGKNGSYPIEPESIAQFVGYDCDGREVYEDDMLVDKEGNKFTARLVCRVLDDEGFLLDIPLEQLKLTEATT